MKPELFYLRFATGIEILIPLFYTVDPNNFCCFIMITTNASQLSNQMFIQLPMIIKQSSAG